MFFTYQDWAEDYQAEPANIPIPPGHHERVRWVVRRRRADLRRIRTADPAARDVLAYTPSGHRRSRRIGPIPLPFPHRRRRR